MENEKTETKLKGEAGVPLLDLQNTRLEEPEEGVYYAYGNIVNLNWTLTDVRIRFGELLSVPNDDDPTWKNQHSLILERVSVTIPWIQAKSLRDLLNTVVTNYEAINGELKQAKLAAGPE
jgi:hypothetical protein